jgi:D-alanyl-D-alanine carboxypeptidase
MIKQLVLSLALMMLLSSCNTTAQGDPQASPTDVDTETQAEMDDTTTRDDSQAFPPEVVAEIQAEMDDLTASTLPPGTAVWIDALEYRFEGASGVADLTDDTPMPPEGAFRIGSITKMFTAVVIVQLAEDGVLTLDDPLALWLPEVAEQLPYGDTITLRHLLTHTSGLFNVVEHESYYADIFAEAEIDEAAGTVTLDCVQRDPHDTLARYVSGKEAQFEPGAQWRYSNTNYTLLGMIIEAAAEMPLAEAYRTHIYEPLDMTSTFLDCYEAPLIDVVHGYTGSKDAMSDVTELHESVGWSAGGLVSTAPDLVAFARGLFGGTLFDDPESLDAIPWLASVSEDDTDFDNFTSLQAALAQQTSAVIMAANLTLHRAFNTLLVSLIGESLSERLLQSIDSCFHREATYLHDADSLGERKYA